MLSSALGVNQTHHHQHQKQSSNRKSSATETGGCGSRGNKKSSRHSTNHRNKKQKSIEKQSAPDSEDDQDRSSSPVFDSDEEWQVQEVVESHLGKSMMKSFLGRAIPIEAIAPLGLSTPSGGSSVSVPGAPPPSVSVNSPALFKKYDQSSKFHLYHHHHQPHADSDQQAHRACNDKCALHKQPLIPRSPIVTSNQHSRCKFDVCQGHSGATAAGKVGGSNSVGSNQSKTGTGSDHSLVCVTNSLGLPSRASERRISAPVVITTAGQQQGAKEEIGSNLNCSSMNSVSARSLNQQSDGDGGCDCAARSMLNGESTKPLDSCLGKFQK